VTCSVPHFFEIMLSGVKIQLYITQNKVYIPVIMESHRNSLPSSSDKFRTAPSGCWPSDQTNKLGPWVRQQAAIVYIHDHHLVLLSQKANTHFTRLCQPNIITQFQLWQWELWTSFKRVVRVQLIFNTFLISSSISKYFWQRPNQ